MSRFLQLPGFQGEGLQGLHAYSLTFLMATVRNDGRSILKSEQAGDTVPAMRTWYPTFAVVQVLSCYRLSRTACPVRADCRAASRICITFTFVSSELRSPFGSSFPLSTAAR